MPYQQVRIMYINACCALSEVNKGNPFMGTREQAMRDINFWRKQCRIAPHRESLK